MAATYPVGQLLQEWREQRGLSRRGLALKAGLGKSTVAYWEAGQRVPSLPEFNAVLDALQVSAAQRIEAIALLAAPRTEQYLRVQEVNGNTVAPPYRSDLLRAMRLRAGCTQLEVASRLQVAQSAVSRWERGEDWPAPEHLHALCYVLGAYEEELVALTAGAFSAQGQGSEEPLDWDALSERFGELVFSTGAVSEALRDLNLLGYEARLWQHRDRVPVAREMLAGAYGWHAQRHRERGWLREAAAMMQKLETLERQESGRYRWWRYHVTVRGHLAVYQQGAPAPLQGVRLLLSELEYLDDLAVRAWAMGDIALYLAQTGDTESAEATAQEALKLAHLHGSGMEIRLRNRDLADVLVQIGQPARALALLTEEISVFPETEIREMQTRAEALLMLRREAEAQACLHRSREMMDVHHLHYLRPRTEALSRRLNR